MRFDGDIIITDPCYLMRDDGGHRNDWEECDYGQNLEVLGINTFITRDTIYGDWGCTTYQIKGQRHFKLGNFCADAGMVTVCLLPEVLAYNPSFDYHVTKLWTTTLIKDFHGEIEFEVEGEEVSVVGKGNINFFTRQTSL